MYKHCRCNPSQSVGALALDSFLAFNVAQVLNAASVIAQERAQKRLLIQNLKTGVYYIAKPFNASVTLI